MTNPDLGPLLAVTDFSDGARRAVDRAARLAAASGAPLHLAHAVTLPTIVPAWGDPGGGAWVDADALLSSANATLEALGRDVERSWKVPCELHVVTGATHRALGELAEGTGAALVVVGAHGSGFRLGRLLGSTAERLLRSARLPVLVVRGDPQQDYRRLVIATDFSGPALAAAALAGRIASSAQCELVHVQEDLFAQLAAYGGGTAAEQQRQRERSATAAMKALHDEVTRLAELGLRATGVVREGQAAEALPRYVAEVGADLLALGAHGRSGLEQLLLGSVSSWLLHRVACDVLVARG